MKYGLGIDAGGTYTDAVILRDSDKSIIDSSKALTSYPDPLEGIKNAIDGLDQTYLDEVNVVSVSTTLSTNSILEGTGFPVALILVGKYDIIKELPTKHYIQVAGGHNHNGIETESLDIESIEHFAMKVKDKVSTFAVSSFFSVRNHDHELEAKKLIDKLTGLPVVCGHELSQDLGAFERAVTAFLNAQLISVTETFMNTVESEIKARGIDAKVFMLKCDGSVTNIRGALDKPIESIFSGPAASLVGASFLTKIDTCAVIDVGGTSTDISVMSNGVPDMSDSGAVVGGWKTRVKAIRMVTSAMGGDSHVWVKGNKSNIGPRRVMPICRAATIYPGFLEQLRSNPIPLKSLLGMNYQPTKFYLRTEYEAIDINDNEIEILEAINKEPTSIKDISSKIKKNPSSQLLDDLIQKRLIHSIGFTLTDALHVLGEYTEMNVEAANVGAHMLGYLMNMDEHEFAIHIKDKFTKNMASEIVSFFLERAPKEVIRQIFDVSSPIKFKVEIPIVLIGGPVIAFVEELQNILDAEIILPKYADVGNAAGALAAKGIRRTEILIRPVSMGAPEFDFLVFSEEGKSSFYEYDEALHYAIDLGKSIVLNYMEFAGLDPDHVKIDVKKHETIAQGWRKPMETKVLVMGISTRDYAD
ncbi:MAG: hydantoinase/oxoprolinase family protein [ANME-2 cluster archaeon]|nr:hydantoinase/oxoprolinase family protein [ANME-2 cluster archaeon]